MRGPNVRSMALDFWRRLWTQLGLSEAVHVERRSDDETRIQIDHRIPHLALRGRAPARYRITTKRLFLRTDYFPDRDVRRRIGMDAAKARNRAVFCEDLRTGEVLSAACFHIDDDRTLPVHLRELALCEVDEVELRARSRFCAHMLLAFLAEIGSKDGRGRQVGFLSENAEQERLARQFGFEPGKRPAAVTRSGDYMVLEPPPRLPLT
jgi:hypothetical protein